MDSSKALVVSNALTTVVSLPDFKAGFWNGKVKGRGLSLNERNESRMRLRELITKSALKEDTKLVLLRDLGFVDSINRFIDFFSAENNEIMAMIERTLYNQDFKISVLDDEEFLDAISKKSAVLKEFMNKLIENDVDYLNEFKVELIADGKFVLKSWYNDFVKQYDRSAYKRIVSEVEKKYSESSSALVKVELISEIFKENGYVWKKIVNHPDYKALNLDYFYFQLLKKERTLKQIIIGEIEDCTKKKDRCKYDLDKASLEYHNFIDKNKDAFRKDFYKLPKVKRIVAENKLLKNLDFSVDSDKVNSYKQKKINSLSAQLSVYEGMKSFPNEYNMAKSFSKFADSDLHNFMKLCEKYNVPVKFFESHKLDDEGQAIFLISSKLSGFLSNYINETHKGDVKVFNDLFIYVHFFQWLFKQDDVNDMRPMSERLTDFTNDVALKSSDYIKSMNAETERKRQARLGNL